METLFSLSSILVMPFWALMMLAPRWRVTQRIVESPFIVAGAVLLYAALVVPELLSLLPAVARPELPTISRLLGTPRGTVIGWAHFLAFDLFVGRWIFLDARARGLSAWVVSPLLLLTLLLGPLGLGAYLGLVTVGWDRVRAFAGRVWSGSRPLAVAVGAAGLLLVSLALQIADARAVLGAPAWMKPAKFGASIAITGVTLAWIIAEMQDQRRRARARIAGAVVAAVAALELIIISVQAARGVPSHFNVSTALDGVLFSVMGAAISVLLLAEVALAVSAFRQRFATSTRTWAIRLGLLGTVAGGALGFLMTRPTPAQLATMRAGQPATAVGAHAVGVSDGGRGLPITRWSVDGGDLRVPHFFGLHALQALPLLAVALERRRRRPTAAPEARQARLVIGAGVGWIGMTAVLLWQALRGQPLVAPDGATLAAALAVLAVSAAVALGGSARFRTLRFARPATASAAITPEIVRVGRR